MTREEAIKNLKYFSLCGAYHQLIHMNDTDSEAITMAIKALEQPEPEIYWGYTPTYERPLADNEIVPCLRGIKAQLGESYAIDRAIEIIEAVAERRTDEQIIE